MTEREIAEALTELLDRTGYKRLEIYRSTPTTQADGYCVRDDGTTWYIRNAKGERN
jgi:hypothetical protein